MEATSSSSSSRRSSRTRKPKEAYSPGGEEERGRRLRKETGGSQQAAPPRKGQRFRQGSASPDLPNYDMTVETTTTTIRMLQVMSRLLPRVVGGSRIFSQTETQDLQSSKSLQ